MILGFVISSIGGILMSLIWILSMPITLIALTLVFLFEKSKYNAKLFTRKYGFPIPKISNPITGHSNEFASRECELNWHKVFGKLVAFYNYDEPQIKIADPSLIDEIFLKRSKQFDGRVYDHRLWIISRSILFNRGELWRKTRKLIAPALAAYRIKPGDTVDSIVDLKSGTKKLIDHFKELIKQKHDYATSGLTSDEEDGEDGFRKGFKVVEDPESVVDYSVDINLHDVMSVITLDANYRLAFNLETIDVTKGAKDPSLRLVRRFMQMPDNPVYKLIFRVPFLRTFLRYLIDLLPAYKNYIRYINGFFGNNLAKSLQRSEIDPKDQTSHANAKDQPRRVYHILMDAYNRGEFKKYELSANIMALVIAGFETTAATSTYIFWCIARHDDERRRLRQDIEKDGLQSRYLDMFIKEVMRMYPALPNFVARKPNNDTRVGGGGGGWTIKRDTTVYMSVNTLHYDESIWPEPYRFDPERFADGKTYPSGAYAPFGLGHRKCAGIDVALREMKTIVCEILKNFDIKLLAPQELTTQSSSIFLTKPTTAIRLRLVPMATTMTRNPSETLHRSLTKDETNKLVGENQSGQVGMDPTKNGYNNNGLDLTDEEE